MKTSRIIALIVFNLLALQAIAQVTFIVDNLPDNTPATDHLYIAGDFTAWNPGSAEYILHKNDQEQWTITLPQQPDGTGILYKFTRGSWETVEKGAGGEEIPNRTFTFGNGETIHISILSWADNGGGAVSTAAANVMVMDDNFFMPQLNRNRRIWLYLPPDYETSGINYPVLYMHDGQNLFDNLTAYAGEWEVDESLNALAALGNHVPIVVGIDNGGSNRIAEYTPWSNLQYGGGDGDLYMRFIVETLKPYIDQQYRTLPGRDNTALMGSSLGGLVTHYGALQYQDVFSKAGIFSPSYWYSDSIWNFTRMAGKEHDIKFYQLCGTLEGGNTVSDVLRMNDSLIQAGFRQEEILNKVVTGGQHNEALWRTSFTDAIRWLFGFGTSDVVDQSGKNALLCFPNPVKDELSVQNLPFNESDTVMIYNIGGQLVKSSPGPSGGRIPVGDLKPGTYIIRLLSGRIILEGRFIKY